MSTLGNGESLLFEVRMSEQTKAGVKDLHKQASLAGKSLGFLTAFRQIAERLKGDPLTFGEPMYRLPSLHLQVRQAVVLPLVVDYAVHEERRLVFIRGFKVLS